MSLAIINYNSEKKKIEKIVNIKKKTITDKIKKFPFYFVNTMDGKQIIANLKKYFFETQLLNKQLKKKYPNSNLCLNNLYLHSIWQLTWLQRKLNGASSSAKIKQTEKNKNKPRTHRGLFQCQYSNE
jgi:hypothetical protein